ncbi:transposase [Nonomuraea wenchangensis]
MTPAELVDVRGRLEDFAGEVFTSFTRREQRSNGGLYLRGLMLDGRRKSMVPMAERLGVDHQRLQQFITSSTWNYVAVRRCLAQRAVKVVAPQAWVLDDTGHLKDGDASPGVARQYTGTAGKVTNCQIAVSVHAVTDACSAALNWRLFLPQRWDDALAEEKTEAVAIAERRRRCRTPDDQRHHPKWQQALGMLAELAGWGLLIRRFRVRAAPLPRNPQGRRCPLGRPKGDRQFGRPPSERSRRSPRQPRAPAPAGLSCTCSR